MSVVQLPKKRGRKSDKRERLIISAKKLILQKGYNETTLADIAEDSGVPLGNVYYYFKTKDAILSEVINQHNQSLEQSFTEWEQFNTAKERLQALIKSGFQSMDETINWGCAIGSLCQELGKFHYEQAKEAATLLEKLIAWTEAQFAGIIDEKSSRKFATNLIANLQGSSLLANTFKNKNIAEEQKEIMLEWIEGIK